MEHVTKDLQYYYFQQTCIAVLNYVLYQFHCFCIVLSFLLILVCIVSSRIWSVQPPFAKISSTFSAGKRKFEKQVVANTSFASGDIKKHLQKITFARSLGRTV